MGSYSSDLSFEFNLIDSRVEFTKEFEELKNTLVILFVKIYIFFLKKNTYFYHFDFTRSHSYIQSIYETYNEIRYK